MRVVNRLSAAFVIMDSVTKQPIENAQIYHDGKIGNCVHKTGGIYVFVNLENKSYNFEVVAGNYQSRMFDVNISDGEGSAIEAAAKGFSAEEILMKSGAIKCEMTHLVKENSLTPYPYAVIKNKNKLYKNKWVTIVQDTKIPYLRVIKTLQEGANEVPINSDFNPCYLQQSFFYGLDYNNSLVFDDYDLDTKLYILKNPLDKKIKTGTLLRPFWKVRTNEKGQLVIPFDVKFFYQESIDYTFMLDGKSVKVKVDTSNGKNPYKIDF